MNDILKPFRKYNLCITNMPSTEAQKRAAAKWIAKNKERHNLLKAEWAKNNSDKMREYDKASKRRRRAYDAAVKVLRMCLL